MNVYFVIRRCNAYDGTRYRIVPYWGRGKEGVGPMIDEVQDEVVRPIFDEV